jgi:hypothetical protein
MKYRLFLLLAFLVFTAPVSAQSPRYARVISQNANLREMPAVTSTAILEIPDETLVKVLDEKLPWYVVRIGNRVGWMHGDTLEFISVGASTQSEANPAPPAVSTSEVRPAIPTVRSPTPGSSRDGGYIRGPRGGCYYISGSGRKVYVDRSLCN